MKINFQKSFKKIIGNGLVFGFSFILSIGLINNNNVFSKETKNKKNSIETDFEKSGVKKNTIIEKTTIPIGDTIEPDYVREIDFDALIIKKNQGTEISKGLLITGKINAVNHEEIETIFIDYNDIEDLLNGIKYIKSTANDWKGISKEKTEFKFSAKDNIEIGFYQEKLTQTFFCNIGKNNKIYLEFKKKESLKEFDKMESQIEKGFELLKNR